MCSALHSAVHCQEGHISGSSRQLEGGVVRRVMNSAVSESSSALPVTPATLPWGRRVVFGGKPSAENVATDDMAIEMTAVGALGALGPSTSNLLWPWLALLY